MDDSHKILSGKKPNINEYVLYDSTEVKFKNRGKYSIVLRLRVVLPQAEGEGRLGLRGSRWSASHLPPSISFL